MIYAFTGAFLFYLAIMAWRVLRLPPPTTPKEFFSFGPKTDKGELRDAFFVTNASFATAFVTLYLMVGSLGYLSIATPVAFIVGCLFFAKRLVPKALPLIATGKRYPALLSEVTGSRAVRVVASIYVIISLWLFTYIELQGFLSFARAQEVTSSVPVLPFLVVISVLVFMGYYSSRLGFCGVVASDRLQRWIIIGGALAFIVLAVASVTGALWENPSTLERITWPQGPLSASLIIMDTLAGFLFAQLLYYDNWQRISAYYARRLTNGGEPHLIEQEVRDSYWTASWMLMVLYSVPLLLAASLVVSGGTITSIDSFYVHLLSLWQQSLFNKVLMSFCFLYLTAALVSTIEVYVISIVNNLIDDISGVMNTQDQASPKEQSGVLLLCRLTVFLVCLSFVPALVTEPNFERLFVYLFFSANGFVGPLLVLVARRKISALGIYLPLAFCAIWPALTTLVPAMQEIAFPGLLTVLVSISLSWLLSRPSEEGR